MPELSKNDLIREDIERRLDEEYDFSKQRYKKKAVEEFVENNPELNTNYSKISKVYNSILKEYSKKTGIQIVKNKKQLLKLSSITTNNDMDAIINSVPQQMENMQLQPMTNPNNISNGPLSQQNPSEITFTYDNESVSTTIQELFMTLKTIIPPDAFSK